MIISFRLRRFLRRLCGTVLVLVLVASMLLLSWLLWLNRYVVYTRDGVRIEFGNSTIFPEGSAAVAPSIAPSLPITYLEETDATLPPTTERDHLIGYAIDITDLLTDPDALQAKLEQIPAGTPVLMDVKSLRGEAFYSSGVVRNSQSADLLRIDRLIAWMKDRFYLIARMPAFQDYWYCLNNVSYGLPKKWAGGALWLDGDLCYWLNPASEGAMSYLVRIITELRTLGFDEVLLSDFRFPDTDLVDFTGDRLATLTQAAADLVNTCASDTFTVSFQRSDLFLSLPESRTRLYLTGISASDAATIAAQALVSGPRSRLFSSRNLTIPDMKNSAFSVRWIPIGQTPQPNKEALWKFENSAPTITISCSPCSTPPFPTKMAGKWIF